LVETAGFNREEAAEFVAAKQESQAPLDFKRGENRIRITPVDTKLSEELDMSKVSTETRKKLKWSKANRTLTFTAPLSEAETAEVKAVAVMDASKEAIDRAGVASRTNAVEIFRTPSELGASFFVPQLEVIIDGELRLFDETEALDYPWKLPLYDTDVDARQLGIIDGASKIKEGGLIDVDETLGKVKTEFARNLERDLGLAYKPEHWNEAKLAAWFCRQIHNPSITHASKRAFVAAWLRKLLSKEGMDLARVNRQKFLLRNLIEEQVKLLRDEAKVRAHQDFLFGDGNNERVRVGSEYAFEFHPDAYAPDRDYITSHEFGVYEFKKHYYPRMGDFDSKEEFECACWLDRQASVEFWVRNLVRKNGASFFLQSATGKFYPDFICKLTDGRILVVEYKGADRWEAAKPNRLLGELWAELSNGKCVFVMVKDKQWGTITTAMGM